MILPANLNSTSATPSSSSSSRCDQLEPPQIREHETTINIEPVKEFSPVELRCVADGIPKPTIKWQRESQTFELPIFDDTIETDTNELDDQREQEGKVGDTNTGDRLRKAAELGSSSSAPNSSILDTQVASQAWSSANRPTSSQRLVADAHQNSPIRTDDTDQTTKTIVKRQSGASTGPNKKYSSARAQLRLEQVEQDAKFGSGVDRWQDMLDAAPESRRASLMMTARRKLIARSAASQQQNWRQRHHQDDAHQQSIDSESVLAGQNNTTATSTSATATPAAPSRPFIGEGETLRIDRVSRYDMGYYMCIASNGVQSSVSQRIFLPVSYVSSTKHTNQANTTRAKENNAAGERAAVIQANNNNNNIVGSSNLDRSVKVREGTKVSHGEPNLGVGSGRGYHRHRQLKAARSSSVSSASSPSVGSLATTTKAVLFTLSAALGIVLMI